MSALPPLPERASPDASPLCPADAGQALAWHGALDGRADWIAGGTALQLQWPGGMPRQPLIDIRGLPGAQRIALSAEGGLRIGAAVTLEQCRRDALVTTHAPMLATACAAIGALSVRHLATLGGNIGWRLGDTLPALLAADAHVELAAGRIVPLDALCTLARQTPLPLLLAVHIPVHIPLAAGGARVPLRFYEKVGQRAAFSPSRATVAGEIALATGGTSAVRLAASAPGWHARRLPRTEALLATHLPRGLPQCLASEAFALAMRADLNSGADAPDSTSQLCITTLLRGHLHALSGGAP
jgi:CO/xanthine dehydrogenase FAD-binding subunit